MELTITLDPAKLEAALRRVRAQRAAARPQRKPRWELVAVVLPVVETRCRTCGSIHRQPAGDPLVERRRIRTGALWAVPTPPSLLPPPSAAPRRIKLLQREVAQCPECWTRPAAEAKMPAALSAASEAEAAPLLPAARPTSSQPDPDLPCGPPAPDRLSVLRLRQAGRLSTHCLGCAAWCYRPGTPQRTFQ